MNKKSLELLKMLAMPDAIVSSGYTKFPTHLRGLPKGILGQFSAGRNVIEFDPEKFNKLKEPNKKNVIRHEGIHAGLRKLMRDYGITGFNKGFPTKREDTEKQKLQHRALRNRDLEKFAGLLGYKGNPNSDTLFNLGEYEKDDKGNYTYVLDDDRMLAGVIPISKSKDKAGRKPIERDMDFEHSIIKHLPRNLDLDTSRANFESRVKPENYRAIRALELYNKLLELRRRKQ